MGVTIAFRGRLKTVDLIPAIIEDVEDICRANSWWFKVINGPKEEQPALPPPKPFSLNDDDDDDDDEGFGFTDNDENDNFEYDIGLRGISFQPHKDSEIIELLFDTEGVLRSIFSMMLIEEVRNKYRWVFVKTQFAGKETHIRIINLLLYLRKKYFKKLDIKDDGGYYPKRDEETLGTRLDFIDNTIATMNDVFENGDFSGTPDEILERVQDALSRSLKDIKIKIIKIDTDDLPEEMKQKFIDNFESDDDEDYRQRRKREDWDDDDELPF